MRTSERSARIPKSRNLIADKENPVLKNIIVARKNHKNTNENAAATTLTRSYT